MRTVIFIIIALALVGAAVYYFAVGNPFSAKPPSGTPRPAAAGEAPTLLPGRSFTVNLREQNKSGESGFAAVTEIGNKIRVELNLTGAPSGAEPAHVHVGSCPAPGAVKYPLANVVGGKSETTLDVPYDDFILGLPLAINVHKSSSEANIYTACGDVGLDPIFPKG